MALRAEQSELRSLGSERATTDKPGRSVPGTRDRTADVIA